MIIVKNKTKFIPPALVTKTFLKIVLIIGTYLCTAYIGYLKVKYFLVHLSVFVSQFLRYVSFEDWPF